MNSPYYQGLMPANWGPPPGYLQALMQRNENNNQALSQIGRFTGAVGSGISGAMEAGRNPEPGVSRLGAGVMNFNAGYNGDSGPRSGGSLGRAMSASGGGGGGMNYTQYAAQAKALRTVLKSYAPDTEEGKAFAAKAETMSLPELESAVQGHALQRADQQAKQQMAADQQRQQLLAAQLGQLQQEQGYNDAFSAATQRAVGQTYTDALAQGRGPIRPQPVTQGQLLQSILATPGAANSQTGSRLLERVFSQNPEDPLRLMAAQTDQQNAFTAAKNAKLRELELFSPRPVPAKPTIIVEDTVNGKRVRRNLTEEQFDKWQEANPDTARALLQKNLTELKAAKAAGKKKVDLNQLMGGGIDLSPWWGGKPIEDGIAYLETKLGGSPAASRASGKSKYTIIEE